MVGLMESAEASGLVDSSPGWGDEEAAIFERDNEYAEEPPLLPIGGGGVHSA